MGAFATSLWDFRGGWFTSNFSRRRTPVFTGQILSPRKNSSNSQDFMVKSATWILKTCYPPVIEQFAVENGPVEIVDFPMKHGNFP